MSLEAVQRNGHNLHIGNYECVGDYDTPVLKPVTALPRLKWLPFNRANTETDRSQKGIHFFMDDYIFQRCWNDPERYAKLLLQYGALTAPNFSLFTDYPLAVQTYNHWRTHQLAAYWQSWGMLVVPCICWSDHSSYSWCFDGEPRHSIISISSLGTQKNPVAKQLFLDGFRETLERLEPLGIVWYGDIPSVCGTLCRERNIFIEPVPAFHHSLAHDRKVR